MEQGETDNPSSTMLEGGMDDGCQQQQGMEGGAVDMDGGVDMGMGGNQYGQQLVS